MRRSGRAPTRVSSRVSSIDRFRAIDRYRDSIVFAIDRHRVSIESMDITIARTMVAPIDARAALRDDDDGTSSRRRSSRGGGVRVRVRVRRARAGGVGAGVARGGGGVVVVVGVVRRRWGAGYDDDDDVGVVGTERRCARGARVR